jgi:5-(carboxyamino)imidazole ribonucleotide mutase
MASKLAKPQQAISRQTKPKNAIRMAQAKARPLVGIIMGSVSDHETMQAAADALGEMGIPYEMEVVSAHRTPLKMVAYAREARARGLEVIIAGAGGAAHLPGMTASLTPLPVIGVPVKSQAMNGMDSLLSIVQMPGGIPVATVAIGNAKNAGLLAARILAIKYPAIAAAVDAHMSRMEAEVRAQKLTSK